MAGSPLNPTLWSQVPEVSNLVLTDSTTLSWDAVANPDGSQVTYGVVRGVLSDLHQTGDLSGATCLADYLTGIRVTDSTLPAPGQGVYYLVRGTSLCSKGTYGTGANGPRVTYSCP